MHSLSYVDGMLLVIHPDFVDVMWPILQQQLRVKGLEANLDKTKAYIPASPWGVYHPKVAALFEQVFDGIELLGAGAQSEVLTWISYSGVLMDPVYKRVERANNLLSFLVRMFQTRCE